jgi:hypothetical protein
MHPETARRGHLLYVALAFLGLDVPPPAMTRTSEEQADIERRVMRQSLRKKARNDEAPGPIDRLRAAGYIR